MAETKSSSTRAKTAAKPDPDTEQSDQPEQAEWNRETHGEPPEDRPTADF